MWYLVRQKKHHQEMCLAQKCHIPIVALLDCHHYALPACRPGYFAAPVSVIHSKYWMF